MPATAETTQVDLNGLSFRCRIEGPEDAPPIVFSNSLMTDLTLWDETAAALAGQWRVLRYDQRGHGGTTVPPGPCSLEQLAGDLLGLLDHFGLQRATLVGISMGGGTVLQLAAQQPERVARVVACDFPPNAAPGSDRAWDERIATAREKGMAALADITLPRWFSPAFQAASPGGLARVRAMIEATPLEGFAACAQALKDFDLRPGMARTTAPVLLLAGSLDAPVEAMRNAVPLLPDARFTAIEGAGHLPNVEQPEAFLAALNSFLPR